jgi:hypothetical protein
MSRRQRGQLQRLTRAERQQRQDRYQRRNRDAKVSKKYMIDPHAPRSKRGRVNINHNS